MTRPDPSSTASAREAAGDDRVLTVAEVAEQLGRSQDWVYRHAKELGGRRAGSGRNPWLFDPSVVERRAPRLAELATRNRREHARLKTKAWPTISASDVDWKSLSQTGCETLAMIAMPVALGFSYAEVAAQAGLSHAEVVARMRKLREELEAQVAARQAS